MKLLADENIPFVKELFSEFAEIELAEGRGISKEDLADIDLLIVRSVTDVDASLIDGTPVKFVGTATIGMDHLDRAYLDGHSIPYVNAPGCNAIAVAEYIMSSLFILAKEQKVDLRHTKVGIVGAGHVGTALGNRLEQLAIPYGYYDPPLERTDTEREYMSYDELKVCDVISLHVPLTTELESKFPTLNMADDEFFKDMSDLKLLINTSRGKVVCSDSLKHWLKESDDHQVILDVWDSEPNIDIELVEQAYIATPHIAGHSFDGKVRGVFSIYQALAAFLEVEPKQDIETYLKKNRPKDIIHVEQGLSFMKALSSVILKVYNVRDDDKALRAGLERDIAQHFDRLRKGYKNRRECSVYRLDPMSLPAGARTALTNIGLRLTDEVPE